MQIAKAQPVGDEEVRGITIHISFNCPRHKTLEEQDAFYMEQAKDLEEALHNTLPGGTYDRLLGLMHQRKASHFIVSWAS